MPFNVQHLGHVSADNIEALLLAAKNDPTLLPSFMTADVSKETKKTDNNADDSEHLSELPKGSSIQSCSDDSSAQNSTKCELSSSTGHPVPTRRSKPTPRPRSYAEVKDDGTSVTAHAPGDPKPKPLVKPKPVRKDRNDGLTDTMDFKPAPHLQPARSEMDVYSQDAPVAPVRRRKPPPTRPMSVTSLPQFVAAEINQTQADNSNITSETDAELPQVSYNKQEDISVPPLPKRSAPPPVPPRVDLE